jgi:hypothetical protein
MDEEDLDARTKRQLHRWMAGGRLGRAERDVIRESVLDELARREGRARASASGKSGERSERGKLIRLAGWAGTALAAAAAVLLMVRVPGEEPGGGGRILEEGDLGARLVLEVTCKGGTLQACPKGSELVFTLSGKRAHGFLSEYAEPVGREGERVFYFSKEDGMAEVGPAAEVASGTKRAVRLSDEHRAGRYRVHAFVADRMLSREEMQSGGQAARVIASLQVELVIAE